jgi:hypothetical protein
MNPEHLPSPPPEDTKKTKIDPVIPIEALKKGRISQGADYEEYSDEEFQKNQKTPTQINISQVPDKDITSQISDIRKQLDDMHTKYEQTDSMEGMGEQRASLFEQLAILEGEKERRANEKALAEAREKRDAMVKSYMHERFTELTEKFKGMSGPEGLTENELNEMLDLSDYIAPSLLKDKNEAREFNLLNLRIHLEDNTLTNDDRKRYLQLLYKKIDNAKAKSETDYRNAA